MSMEADELEDAAFVPTGRSVSMLIRLLVQLLMLLQLLLHLMCVERCWRRMLMLCSFLVYLKLA